MADTEEFRRERLKPVLDEMIAARKAMTEAGNWLAENWPMDLPVPWVSAPPRGTRFAFFVSVNTKSEFDRAADLLDAEPFPTAHDGHSWRRVRRCFGEVAVVEAWLEVAAP